MATHSSIFAWKIPWTEEPGRLQSMGLQRVGHDRATSLNKLKTELTLQFQGNSVSSEAEHSSDTFTPSAYCKVK